MHWITGRKKTLEFLAITLNLYASLLDQRSSETKAKQAEWCRRRNQDRENTNLGFVCACLFFCKIISDSRPSSSRLRILSSQFITNLALVNILITSRLNVFAFYLFVVSVTMNLFKKSAYIKMSSSSFHQLQQR